MDIKAKIEEIVNKVKNDKDLKDRFMKEPVEVVEELAGVDLPKEQISGVVDAVKAKINIDDVVGKLGGLGGLFKK